MALNKISKRSTLLLSDRVDIKPLSVNQAWQGKRFKSPAYKEYIKELSPKLKIGNYDFGKNPLELFVRVGFSSSASDLDNVLKPFQDILSAHYKFNDKQIFRIIAEKELVPKGMEYIEYSITRLEHPLILRVGESLFD
ncbi:MAG: RusA family crossover junction endodeoxyribonuclease [Bacteroidota bacterium]|jgi:Holliday junction resolvase RusA-like endonuclease